MPCLIPARVASPRMLRPARALMVVLLCATLAVTSTGCSFLAPSTQDVAITADDPDAAIFINHRYVGSGEVVLPLRKNQHYRVWAELDGQRGRIVHLSPQISTVGVLDLVGAILFLIPGIGVFAPGFYNLPPGTVRLETTPPAPRQTPPQQAGPQRVE